jgi:pilus assembly protein CpaF
MQGIYRFEQKGVDESGKVLGQLAPTGIRPKLLQRIDAFGIDLRTILDPYLRE